jgi:hypothetical protein
MKNQSPHGYHQAAQTASAQARMKWLKKLVMNSKSSDISTNSKSGWTELLHKSLLMKTSFESWWLPLNESLSLPSIRS